MNFRIRDGKTVMVMPEGARAIERSAATVNNTMVKVIAWGFRWQRLLADGIFNTIDDPADSERINASYVSRVLRLTFLAPELVESILGGRHPAHLTMKGRFRRIGGSSRSDFSEHGQCGQSQ